MMMLKFEKIHRVWLSRSGQAFPDYGYASSVKIKGDRVIEATFKANYSEYDALVEGLDFEVRQQHPLLRWCHLKGGELHCNGMEFTTERQVNNPQVQAVCTPSGRDGFFLDVVEQISGDNQIEIGEGRKCNVSPNISPYPIRVRLPILLPRVVLIDKNKPLRAINLHLIGTWEDGAPYYADLPCEILPTPKVVEELQKNTRTLQFRYDADRAGVSSIDELNSR